VTEERVSVGLPIGRVVMVEPLYAVGEDVVDEDVHVVVGVVVVDDHDVAVAVAVAGADVADASPDLTRLRRHQHHPMDP